MRLKPTVFLCALLPFAFVWIITCVKTPTDPFTKENSTISLLLVSSNFNSSKTEITDTAGKPVQISVCMYLSEYIDSAHIVIRPDQASLDTSITYHSEGKLYDTAKYTLVFNRVGAHTVTATAYMGKEYRQITAVINIVAKPGQNHEPVLVIGGNRNVVAGQTCVLSVAVKDPDIDQTHSIEVRNSPTGATFSENTFSWQTTIADTGTHPVIFIATEIGTTPALVDTDTVAIKVTETLTPPARPENLTILENKDGFLTLGWKQSARADAYFIYRGAFKRGAYTMIDSTIDTLYKDSIGATSWYYYIQARNTKGTSPASDTIYFDGTIVNRPPVLSVSGRRNLITGETCSLTVFVNDPDLGQTHTFDTVGSPQGASFENRTFVWTTGASDTGSHEVTFTVHDNGTPQLRDSETVIIRVSDTLEPPEKPLGLALDEQISRIVSLSWEAAVRADQYYLYRATATTGEFSVLDTVTGTKVRDTVPALGNFFYYLQAVNSQGISPSSDTLKVEVTDTVSNHAPVFGTTTPGSSYSIKEGEILKVPVTVTDPDGDRVSWSIAGTTLPRSSTLLPGKDSLSWQSQTGDSGSFTITLRATDGMDSTETKFVVLVGDVNAPPVWKKKILAVSVNEAQSYSLSLPDTIITTDNDPLTYTLLAGSPIGDSIDAQNRYQYSPGYSDSGAYTITIVASDGSLTDTLTINLHVVNSNRLPAIGGANDTTIKIGSSIQFTVTATDPDADTVTLSATGVPTGATFTAASGVFSWTPEAAQSGQFPITFIAKDGIDSVTRKITITISNNEKPVITLDPVDRTVLSGQPDSFTVAATGAGTLSYQWQKNGTDLAGKTGTVLKLAPVAIADTGSYTCIVSNDGGRTTSKSARLTVQFTLSYDGNQKTSGTVPASANYNFGAKVAVAGNTGSLARTGYTFTGWNSKADGTGTSYSPGDSLTIGPSHSTLYAKWSQKTSFTLTIAATNGSVTKSPDATAYDSGTVVTLTPVPAPGFHFLNWSGALTGTANPATITMNSAKTVTANFEANPPNTFTLTVVAANGTVKKTPDLPQYDSGATVSLKATAAAGYHFVNWTGDTTGTADSTTVKMTKAKSVTANFAINTYQLTMAAGAGGTITLPATSPATVNHGAATTITAVPSAGYDFDKWTATTGTATIATASSAATTVTLTSGNATVTASFRAKVYQLTVSADTGGSITAPASSPAPATHGVPITITASPSTGYDFIGWTVTTGTATIATASSASTTVMLTSGDATVKASFRIKTYQLTVSAGTGGSITAPSTSPATATHGVAVTITAAQGTGYTFSNWTVTTGTATIANANAASTTVTLSSGDATITAIFSQNPYTLTMSNDGHGTTTPAAGAVSVAPGTATSITATPAGGYQFTNWTVTTGTATIASATIANTTVTLSSGNATIKANFSLIPYTLTMSNDGHGTTTPAAGTVSVTPGVATSILATPATGYQFTNWTVTTGTATFASATSASTTVTLSAGNATVRANFELKPCIVTFTSQGTAYLSSTVNYGTTVSAPTPPTRSCYTFGGWCTDEGGLSLYNFATAVTTSFPLYAKWTPNGQYPVQFYSQGSLYSTVNVNCGATVSAPTTPVLACSTFTAWYTDIGRTNQYNFLTPVMGTFSLYAGWMDKSLSITSQPSPATWDCTASFVSFSVQVSQTSNNSYQWFYSDNGTTTPCTGPTFRNYNTSTLIATPPPSGPTTVWCEVTNCSKKVTTNHVAFSFATITLAHPYGSAPITLCTSTPISVGNTPCAVSYEWYVDWWGTGSYSLIDPSNTSFSGQETGTLTYTGIVAANVYCVVTDMSGNRVTSGVWLWTGASCQYNSGRLPMEISSILYPGVTAQEIISPTYSEHDRSLNSVFDPITMLEGFRAG